MANLLYLLSSQNGITSVPPSTFHQVILKIISLHSYITRSPCALSFRGMPLSDHVKIRLSVVLLRYGNYQRGFAPH